ncbi:MAG TPA: PP2C family serine/threonine-protein phosphatase [Acidimicrobiales bacterium]|nr:PP2C family serine/threonine-protein phosphatase [Acidimicrobiales bacterium]
MSNAVATACPACGAPVEPADDFCEACGARLTAGEQRAPASFAAGSCSGCGAPPEAIGSDGYCSRCGLRQPSPRDHHEIDLGVTAGVTDRGLRHHRNEDALFLKVAGDGTIVAVVCDGVSTSIDPDVASQAATDAAGESLVAAVENHADHLIDVTRQAIDTAQEAVARVPWTPTDDMAAPATTFVSAVCQPGTIALGWVGDSRAYWLGSTSAQRLTVDDSWAEEQVDAGTMTEAEADADPRAHSITRWLGADAPTGEWQVTTFTPDGPCRLLLCSDGLWIYAPTAAQLAELLAGQPADASLLAITRFFTDFALAGGGHDNITVVIVDFLTRDRQGGS